MCKNSIVLILHQVRRWRARGRHARSRETIGRVVVVSGCREHHSDAGRREIRAGCRGRRCRCCAVEGMHEPRSRPCALVGAGPGASWPAPAGQVVEQGARGEPRGTYSLWQLPEISTDRVSVQNGDYERFSPSNFHTLRGKRRLGGDRQDQWNTYTAPLSGAVLSASLPLTSLAALPSWDAPTAKVSPDSATLMPK